MSHPSRRRLLTAAAALPLAGCGASRADDATVGTVGTASQAPQQTPQQAPQQESQPAPGPAVADGNEAVRRLLDGNARFVAAKEHYLNEGAERRIAVSQAQHPFATILGCVDSRVPIELVFDQGLGDLVVVRSAGEALDHSVTGSVEFGVAELHTPLVMVLGHQRCGALTAALQAVDTATHDHGEIDYIVDTLKPAVRQAAAQPGDRLTNAVKANVALTVTALRRSPVIGPQEQAGKIKVVGAYYELDTGKVALI